MWRLVDFTAFAIGVDIEKTEDAVIDSEDVKCTEDLLRKVKGVNRAKIKKFIFEKGTANEVFSFAHNTKMWHSETNMKDIFEAKKIVLNSKDDFAILMWARYIGDVEEAREATNKIEDKDAIKYFNKEFPKQSIKTNFFDRFKK